MPIYNHFSAEEAALSGYVNGMNLVMMKIGITAAITAMKKTLYPRASLRKPETAPVIITERFMIPEANA